MPWEQLLQVGGPGVFLAFLIWKEWSGKRHGDDPVTQWKDLATYWEQRALRCETALADHTRPPTNE